MLNFFNRPRFIKVVFFFFNFGLNHAGIELKNAKLFSSESSLSTGTVDK